MFRSLSRKTARPIFKTLAIGPLAVLCAACGGEVAQEVADTGASDDPPGAALPLSIGGRAEAAGDTEFDLAVNCAAALSLTAERLAQMANNPVSDEIALLGRAQRHFETQAGSAQTASDDIVGSATAAIARRRQEEASQSSAQAQLAIACLRRFGDDIGAATGSQIAL